MTDEELVSAVSRQIRIVAKQLCGMSVAAGSYLYDADDLYQIGVMAALAARARWQPDGGVPLEKWCQMRGTGAVLDAARHQKNRRHRFAPVPLSDLHIEEYSPSAALLTTDDQPDEPVPVGDLVRKLGAVMDRREREILTDYYGRGLMLKAVGRKHRMTESGAFKALRKALRSVTLAVAANNIDRHEAARRFGVA